MINTISLCPVCYEDIPATIHLNTKVTMIKICPEHGYFSSIVERDPIWWLACRALNCKSIYNGYLLDVTNQCNLKCKYCYHENKNEHKPVDEIINEVEMYKHLNPIILTGGECTLHPELKTILSKTKKITSTFILTNGVKLSDEGYFDDIVKELPTVNNRLAIGLSFHKESNGKDIQFLELLQKKNLKIDTCFYVIDELAQIDDAIKVFEEYKGVIKSLRIKAASNLWSENQAKNKIFTSDMFYYLKSKGPTELISNYNNKTSFANVMYKKMYIMLISWYDRYNVDLLDINCPPYYKAKDGNVYNLVTTCLKNEKV